MGKWAVAQELRRYAICLILLNSASISLYIRPVMLPAKRTDPAHAHALDTVLSRLLGGRSGGPDRPDGWVTAVRRLAPRQAQYSAFPDGVDPRLCEVLSDRGVERLYTHQTAAIEHAVARRHVVITTPTASGKTLCYNAPVLSAILRDASTRALYLFPTKALAQDQLAELHELSDQVSRRTEHEIGVFTYDGDTPQDARRAIRGRAHVVLSNPDMIHSGSSRTTRVGQALRKLKYVVIDELHAYRGVFGSHLNERLAPATRICQHYGSDPTFICSSETIANPRESPRRWSSGRSSSSPRVGHRAARRCFSRQSAGREPAARNPPVLFGETRRVAQSF